MEFFRDKQNIRLLYSKGFLLVCWVALLFPLTQKGLTLNTINSAFRGKVALSGYFNSMRIWLGDRYYEKVVVGNDGWMYLMGDSAIAGYQQMPLDRIETANNIASDLGAFNRELALRGIKLMVVIAPDKGSIYPQYLPKEMASQAGKTYTDVFIEGLLENQVHFVDLRPPFLEASSEDQLYYKTDTHWNFNGDYLAYRTVVDEISHEYPNVEATPFSELRLISDGFMNRDIPALLRVNGFQEETLLLVPKKNKAIKYEDVPLGSMRTLSFSSHANKDLPRILIYHDSFFAHVVPLMQQNFSQTVSIFYPAEILSVWNAGWVEQVEPDIVILEFTERLLFFMEWPIYFE